MGAAINRMGFRSKKSFSIPDCEINNVNKNLRSEDYSQLPNKSGGRNKYGGWENGKFLKSKYFK